MTTLDPTEIFRQEASDLFDVLESALLDLGSRPDDRELVDTAFRALHTIKGSGAMFGFDAVAAFTHEFESAFDRVRKGEIKPTQDLISVALSAKDYIRALIEEPESTDSIIGDAILDDLRHFVSPGEHVETGSSAVQESPVAEGGGIGWQLHLEFDGDILRNGSNPLDLLDDLRKLGACFVIAQTDDVPLLDKLEPEYCFLKWDVTLHSDCDRAAIDDVFMFVMDEIKLDCTPLVAADEAALAPSDKQAGYTLQLDAEPPAEPDHKPAASPEIAKPAAALPEKKQDEQRRHDDKGIATVRVQAERLDELMDRVGELVIAQARLSQLAAATDDIAIKGIAEEIERLASSLRDTTMGARMVPIGSLFGRFRRLIHDLSRDLGKPVDFVTTGEETELDKTMIERLADPLVHLIRNAIDHGIEATETRNASGKTDIGRIEIAAIHSGAQVLVTVRDNGAGLNTARIRAKAEEQGLIAPGVAMSDQDIYQLLFAPGFSTAQTISALSGRGVGMDVVKRTIEAMRGSIDIGTQPGQGTTVTLRLPLTLAIIEGLLIRVGEGRYIIPLSAVEECAEMTADDQRVRGRDFLNMHGDLVPFLRLRGLFDAVGEPDQHQKIIIASSGESRVGLIVDQIIGSHQSVIKSLSKLHSGVTMFSGATILGDGSAALILDVAQLIVTGQSAAESHSVSEAA
ncbi:MULTISPECIES: chemotaxis protein CheA [Rhodopseudomonas]|uniref:Chemotaxis protein CheA n=1 Tax=Rhodopseudomonas palustris TaxID=1076 RepID=A0A0D7DY81_RHOPL|nr:MULTISPECIES: chemotaxis protein CheA [Rhodopseudomonas]KIZ33191.1 chemotaxis protein CheA [Rhodopseudomonas palustris]MDF3810947.1 chemotaxis protein CheA [Rhodopseudomonas sp. BAL398]WOK16930.1 chemotaxis protein CheA [Rhodopseudomonas sp. BAL398]